MLDWRSQVDRPQNSRNWRGLPLAGVDLDNEVAGMVRLAFIPSYFFFLVTCVPWLFGHEGGTLESSWDRRRTPAVEVFERASTSVVNISTTQMIAVRSPFGIDRFFEELFEFPSRRYSRQSVGSGFVLHSAGYVVTNAHVVARTTDRQVIFADQSKYDAKIIACLLYTSPSPRDGLLSRMPSSA